MISLLTAISIIGSIFLTPFLVLLACILFLASIGQSIGVRTLYVKILLSIFEYGRKDIEHTQNTKNSRKNSIAENEAHNEELVIPTRDPSAVKSSIKINGVKNGFANDANHVISRDDNLILVPEPISSPIDNAKVSYDENQGNSSDFELNTVIDYIRSGIEAIIEDQVTSRFEAEELKNWNMLIRTQGGYEFISWKLTILWMCGFIFRYLFLFPLRVTICFIGVLWLTLCTALVGYVKNGEFKTFLNKYVSIMCFGILSRAISSVITYHNEENKPKNGICVANHTSPIDVLILMCDNCYSLIGQRHGGFLGIFQRALARASPHIWFERSETRDRTAVTKRLKEHISDPKNPPILIFPEGTCINNTSVMQFKKGSFEVGSVIYPVAIKYDPRFGDAFWNSSKYSALQYLYMMMTSWAIVCDVWYLPPMYKKEGESAIDFANRVKSAIARQGGLVDLMWDGQLKRMKAKKEWMERQQEEFSRRLKVDQNN